MKENFCAISRGNAGGIDSFFSPKQFAAKSVANYMQIPNFKNRSAETSGELGCFL
jgi:hypothetical protein